MEGQTSCIMIKKRSIIYKIPLRDILYICKNLRLSCVITISGEQHTFYAKFDEIQPFLNKSFLQCHKSYIVNLEKVIALQAAWFWLENGEHLPISQKRRKKSREYYQNYLRGNL
ncbi:LytR/AlgR family response regulator transcription factor [Anaerovorax sp. IOR16]|uniref:LytR/AlgR family response regulator transcription factor n=1 Tax=Anaerovorax sp. IOR16 TaxID=2773458 RepID=UPI0019D1226C|nr:LytTR family transcriptional regulator DNA-binding domain-containing protein [Anaerovorax sp. IOR16]